MIENICRNKDERILKIKIKFLNVMTNEDMVNKFIYCDYIDMTVSIFPKIDNLGFNNKWYRQNKNCNSSH